MKFIFKGQDKPPFGKKKEEKDEPSTEDDPEAARDAKEESKGEESGDWSGDYDPSDTSHEFGNDDGEGGNPDDGNGPLSAQGEDSIKGEGENGAPEGKGKVSMRVEDHEEGDGHRVHFHDEVNADLRGDSDYQHHVTEHSKHMAGHLIHKDEDPDKAEAHRHAANLHARIGNALHSGGDTEPRRQQAADRAEQLEQMPDGAMVGPDGLPMDPEEDDGQFPHGFGEDQWNDGEDVAFPGVEEQSPGEDLAGNEQPAKPDKKRNAPSRDSRIEAKRKRGGVSAPKLTLGGTEKSLSKAGPYIGPRGGKWADAKHTIPWKERRYSATREDVASRIEGILNKKPKLPDFDEGVKVSPEQGAKNRKKLEDYIDSLPASQKKSKVHKTDRWRQRENLTHPSKWVGKVFGIEKRQTAYSVAIKLGLPTEGNAKTLLQEAAKAGFVRKVSMSNDWEAIPKSTKKSKVHKTRRLNKKDRERMARDREDDLKSSETIDHRERKDLEHEIRMLRDHHGAPNLVFDEVKGRVRSVMDKPVKMAKSAKSKAPKKLPARSAKAMSAMKRFGTLVPGGTCMTDSTYFSLEKKGFVEYAGHQQYRLSAKGEKVLEQHTLAANIENERWGLVPREHWPESEKKKWPQKSQHHTMQKATEFPYSW